MKIISQQNNQVNYRPNFKGINLVQIPKSAFSGGNLSEAETTFRNALKEIAGEKVHSSVSRVLKALAGLIGIPKTKAKRMVFLEQFYYPEVIDRFNSLKESRQIADNCSLDWLSRHAGIPIAKSIDGQKHSFFVFTNEHAVQARDVIDRNVFKAPLEAVKYALQKIKMGQIAMGEMRLIRDIGINDIMTKGINEVKNGVPVKHFDLQNLDQLPEAYKNFD